jgi:tRNA pseudouridine38-40 synthase
MRNIKLTIEYDGTNFVGWQMQSNGRSVQEEISKAIGQILREPVTLIGAGRTDSGVHARGQVANFHTRSTMDAQAILNGLNGVLPEDICLHAADDVPQSFHARYDARLRTYRYFVSHGPSPIGRYFQWFVKFRLDVDVMNDAAQMLPGEHDFESFCKSEAEVNHFRCTIMKSRWAEASGMIVYEIEANRFLHGMVRALVGTMVDIGRGFLPLSSFQEIMTAKDRSKAGMAAPPQGLFLEQVLY